MIIPGPTTSTAWSDPDVVDPAGPGELLLVALAPRTRGQRISPGYWYHLESEIDKPGTGGNSCDDLEAGHIDAGDPPISASAGGRGAGARTGSTIPASPEEVKVFPNEPAIPGNARCTPWVQLLGRRSTPDTVGDAAEVDLSFAYGWADDWLGEFGYKADPRYDLDSADQIRLRPSNGSW